MEKGASKSQVGQRIDVPLNTLSTWLKKRDSIKVAFESGPACNGTLESRRSQGYVSMGSSSTYMIDATGADPVLLHGADFPDHCYRNGSSAPLLYGYPGNDVDRSVVQFR